jgi:S-methylmethionine-dependent homocysteine/selenocysteine methylase
VDFALIIINNFETSKMERNSQNNTFNLDLLGKKSITAAITQQKLLDLSQKLSIQFSISISLS